MYILGYYISLDMIWFSIRYDILGYTYSMNKVGIQWDMLYYINLYLICEMNKK